MPPKLASDPPTPLREQLARIEMSHAGFARALNIDRRSARMYVTGEYTPKPERRALIAQIVGSTVEELWPDAYRSAAGQRAGEAHQAMLSSIGPSCPALEVRQISFESGRGGAWTVVIGAVKKPDPDSDRRPA